MKTALKLTNPLWRTQERRQLLDKAVQQSAAELEGLIKQKILTGTKSGKLYRRGAIRKQVAKRDLAFYRSNKKIFRRQFTSLYRETTVVGYNFHRASAPGESPASDTGGLVNSIRAKKLGFMSAKVATSKRYSAALDNGATIPGRNKRTKVVGPMKNRVIKPRPFFIVTAEEYKPKFKENILKVMKENK